MSADQITQLVTQLGISVVFLWLWFQEHKERQQLYAQMLEMQTTHRTEMMRIIERLARIPQDTPPVP